MSARRVPQQSRSVNTVNSIVESAFAIVAENGIDALTTRRIADTAGVGIGSVYEYFDNKQAILDEMRSRLIDDLVEQMRPRIAEWIELGLRDAVIALLSSIRDFLATGNGRYGKFLSRQGPDDMRQSLSGINKLLHDLTIQYLIRHPQYATVPNLPVMSYIWIHGGVAVIGQHLLEKNPRFAFDQIALGLAEMVERMVIDAPERRQAAGTTP